ncbi:MAG: type VI secretion system tube protein TssD [Bacteroides fragilis]
MQTHLYLHKENTDLPHDEYRGKYPLKHFDYGLSRNVGRKGEITSGLCGGEIRIVIDGFSDATLLGWLFTPSVKKMGRLLHWMNTKRPLPNCNFRAHR